MESQFGLVQSRGLQPRQLLIQADVTEAPGSSGQPATGPSVSPVTPKDQVVLAIAGLLCVANETLAAWAEVAKLEAAIQACEKRKEAIEKGCYPCPQPPGYSYSPTPAQVTTGGASGSPADYAWTQLAALLRICTGAAQQWAASYKPQPYAAPEDELTKTTEGDKATEGERKPASRSGPK